MSTYRLILDLATDRVIWFTDDLNLNLTTDETTVTALYQGELPAGLTLKNAWNWRYRNKSLENTEQPKTSKSLLEQNRDSMREMVNFRFTEAMNKLLPSTPAQRLIYDKTLEDAYSYFKDRSTTRSTTVGSWLALKSGEGVDVDLLARSIINAHHDFLIKIQQLEKARLSFVQRVDVATTDQELFTIRDEVFEKISSMTTN